MPARRSRMPFREVTGVATFFETVTAAVADITEHGYDSDRRLDYWVEQIRKAAIDSLISEPELQEKLKTVLGAAYDRLVERGRILQHHPGVGRFTIARIKPKLRAELDRRILASANLIRLNRQQTIADTLKRFQGWATSIPIGGSRTVDRGEIKNHVRKELASLPFRERRVLIDQANKLFCSVNAILATDQGAIAAEWRSNYRQLGYDFRPEHRDRDSRYRGPDWVYLIRGSWAHKRGLVKAGKAGFVDQITQPSEEIFCRCFWAHHYSLSRLPDAMLTERGRKALAQTRSAA